MAKRSSRVLVPAGEPEKVDWRTLPRKPPGKKKSATINGIRCTECELEEIRAAARKSDETFAEFIRASVLRAARRVLSSNPGRAQ